MTLNARFGPVELLPHRIRTPRLELLPGTLDILRAELEGPDALSAALGATVPVPGWPPGEWDEPAIRWMLNAMERGDTPAGWGAWYYVRAADRLLVGAGGYKGPPDEDGTVEIGYSVVDAVQRQGYATEAARGLAVRAFADARVTRVVAETLPHLAASLGVMRKLGFRPAQDPSEEGVVRLELTRADAVG
jgi:[ribosomal protein S5]-alanine N-acetyltransferase